LGIIVQNFVVECPGSSESLQFLSGDVFSRILYTCTCVRKMRRQWELVVPARQQSLQMMRRSLSTTYSALDDRRRWQWMQAKQRTW